MLVACGGIGRAVGEYSDSPSIRGFQGSLQLVVLRVRRGRNSLLLTVAGGIHNVKKKLGLKKG